MRPIPKRLLIHTAELKTVGINNTWQDEKITDMTKLKKIRIEPCSRLVTAKDNRQVSLSAAVLKIRFSVRDRRSYGTALNTLSKLLNRCMTTISCIIMNWG